MENNNNNVKTYLLPIQWNSAYITYWSPMKKENFISSGYVWFDYKLQVYRIDGIFNPWDIDKNGYQLWMSEITFYGQGKSHVYKVPYYIKQEDTITELFNYETAEVEVYEVEVNKVIIPRDILIIGKANLKRTDKILGMEVDCWEFDKNNPFNMQRFYTKKGTTELVRMQQFKNGQILIRDFPNLSTEPIEQKIFNYSSELSS